MAAWQQTPTGYYPGQSAPPPPPGFYPEGAYPEPGGYSQQGGYPPKQGQGFPPVAGGAGFLPKIGLGRQAEQNPNMYASYPEDGGGNFTFSEKSIRMAFIRKVYSILMCQLLVTLGISLLFILHAPINNYVRSNPSAWWLSFVLAFATMLVITCCGDLRRKSPHNFIALFIFTVAESALVGCTVVHYRFDSVIYAIGICAVICLGLTIFAFQTKIDFTVMGGALFVGALVLCLFGILLAIFGPGKTTMLVYGCIGAFLFSLYIIYDTQMMIGGEHKYSISPEEYIFAALNLYIDIINLFLYILTIISSSRD